MTKYGQFNTELDLPEKRFYWQQREEYKNKNKNTSIQLKYLPTHTYLYIYSYNYVCIIGGVFTKGSG